MARKLPKMFDALPKELAKHRKFMVLVPHYWGSGVTVEEAVKKMQAAGGPTALTTTELLVLDVDALTWVNDAGTVRSAPDKAPPRELLTYCPGEKKKTG